MFKKFIFPIFTIVIILVYYSCIEENTFIDKEINSEFIISDIKIKINLYNKSIGSPHSSVISFE